MAAAARARQGVSRRMELRHLRYFAALAEQLNFTRAAETVHVTQSTLSHQIKQLETEIGHRLFDRIGKRIVITEAGEQLLGKVKLALSEIDDGLRGAARLGPAVERQPADRRDPHVQRQPAADLHRHLLPQAPVGSRHRAGAERRVGRARASKAASSISASPTGRTARRPSRSSRCATTRWRWWFRRAHPLAEPQAHPDGGAASAEPGAVDQRHHHAGAAGGLVPLGRRRAGHRGGDESDRVGARAGAPHATSARSFRVRR